MILLITSFPPDSPTGGACIVRQCLSRMGKQDIHWISLAAPSGMVPFKHANITQEHFIAPRYGNVRLGLAKFWSWYYLHVWTRLVARKISKQITGRRAAVIWMVLDYPLLPVGVRLLPVLSSERVHVSVHDDPLSSALREGAAPSYCDQITRFLAGLRRIKHTADAVSEELLTQSVPNASANAIVTMGLDRDTCAHKFEALGKTERLEIGYSGNFCGLAEFSCFVEGLHRWSAISKRDWRIHAFGNEKLGHLDERVDAHGYTPPDDVRRALQKCDLLLLPVPIHCEQMRTSLPTKLVSFLEFGRPIFTFAPEMSATARIVKQARLGPVVSKLDPDLVCRELQQLESFSVADAEVGWENLISNRFNANRICRDLESLLSGMPVDT